LPAGGEADKSGAVIGEKGMASTEEVDFDYGKALEFLREKREQR
jgi:hypothetical protein